MCGIIGVTGRDDALEAIVAGLGRLEYRGYDSAGVVLPDRQSLRVVKRSGKLDNLRNALDGQSLAGRVGLGHTRWATHGAPTDRNAHPHLDPDGRVGVIHNGIIENYESLKAELGPQFDGNYQHLSDEILEAWRFFFRSSSTALRSFFSLRSSFFAAAAASSFCLRSSPMPGLFGAGAVSSGGMSAADISPSRSTAKDTSCCWPLLSRTWPITKLSRF